MVMNTGASILGVGGRDPKRFWAGGRGGRWGSWEGREILLYRIMYVQELCSEVVTSEEK